ncbi:MAG: hypothetical protein ACR2OY_01215 [Boseongicola sp.]
MRQKIFVILGFLAALTATQSVARDCTPAEKQRVLEPATAGNTTVRLRCDLTLGAGETVTKQIRILGNNSSGVRLVCRGGIIGTVGRNSLLYRKDMIQIRSIKRSGNAWSRPENVVISGCRVNGAIRLSGLGPNGQAKNVRASSRSANHTRVAQDSAPKNILLKNLFVVADGRIPVYFAPGVTNSKLIDSTIVGTSKSSGLYLDAETASNTIQGNVFDVRTPREILSIDGSAHNVVANNRFQASDSGGVYVYRNCGEGGAARHQKPMFNQIKNNRFLYNGSQPPRPTIWLSYKSIGRTVLFCPQDRKIPYGSGIDDQNFADQNIVSGNAFVNSPISAVIRNGGTENRVFSNHRVRK